MNGLIRSCGIALVIGGALLILINVILTPLLPEQEGEVAVRSSTVYLLRLSSSGVVALLLVLGSLGLRLIRTGSGVFGSVAFAVAFIGSSLLVAAEWANVFVLRAVAETSPEALGALGDSSLMRMGFVSAAGLFSLGWLLVAIDLLRTREFARWGGLSVVAGLILIPVLGATPLGSVGAIAGNVVFGAGLVGLGHAVARACAVQNK
jgi:hypothetical protein